MSGAVGVDLVRQLVERTNGAASAPETVDLPPDEVPHAANQASSSQDDDPLVRELTDITDRLRRCAFNCDGDPIDAVIQSLQRLRHQSTPTDPFQIEIAKALAEIKTALGKKGRRNRKPLFNVDAAELLGEEFPDTPWQITGLIPVGGVAIVGGGPKEAKKTWKATEMALAVATGTKAFGEFYAQQGSARYFYAEDMKRQIRNRIRALLAGADRTIAKDALLLCPRGEFIDVLQDEELAWILASCRQGSKPALVVLDPLSDIHSGEEDKRDSMREVMRRLRLLAELVGCTVIAVHHVVKPNESTKGRSGGQRLRGSSAIHGSLDCGIYVLECEGDGVSTFKNTVQSEVKGARSAGKFTLELCIEDDAGGEAIRATWSVSREASSEPKPTKKAAAAAAKATQAIADDDTALGFVRTLAMRGVHLSKSALRDHDEATLGERRMRPALDRLIESGRLVIMGGKVRIPEPEPHHAG